VALFGLNLVTIALVLVVGIVGLIGLRFGAAFLEALQDGRRDPTDYASNRTRAFVGLTLGGLTSLIVTGVVSLTDVLGMFADLIAMNPVAVSNLGVGGLGAAAIAGLVSINWETYVGLSLVVVGFVMTITLGDRR
jgi:hypothetical protein